MKLTHRIKTRLTLLGVTVSFAVAGVILSRIAYVPYNGDRDIIVNWFDYKYLSSFLYSFGIEIAFILTGMVINFSTNFMEKPAQVPFRSFGWAVQFIGFFFMFWIFLDTSIFTDNVEIAFSVVAAIASVYLIRLFTKFYRGRYARLLKIIRGLFDFIFVEAEAEQYVRPEKKRKFITRRVKLLENAVDNE